MGNYGCTSLRIAKVQLFSIQAEKSVKNFLHLFQKNENYVKNVSE